MARSFALVALLAAAVCLAAAVEPAPSQLATSKPGNVGVELSELYLRSSTREKQARVYIGTGDRTYSMGLNNNGDFSVAVNLKSGTCDGVSSAPGEKGSSDCDLAVISGGDGGGAAVSNVLARRVRASSLVLRGVPQWSMIRMDMFEDPTSSFLEVDAPATADKQHGWTKSDVLKCQGLSILTVKDGQHPISKAFKNLPPHTQVKVLATAHFVDDWQGETAYLRVNDQYAWTDSHELRNSAHALSVCGSPLFPETKFRVPVEVTLRHSDDVLKLEFGATTEGTSQAIFGISDVQVYIRDSNAK